MALTVVLAAGIALAADSGDWHSGYSNHSTYSTGVHQALGIRFTFVPRVA
ncbi:MAG: hypothetical protein WBV06_18790 [Acidimicrobiia bacterium]